MRMRRRSKRTLYVGLGIFVAVFLFSFLIQKFKGDGTADAASLAGFDPGYIISDYQMSNYNSMSEAEIQAFMSSKNHCNNRDYGLYQLMINRYPSINWHWENGHFVCISEELFGDGETIGVGDTAAHIIWQAAQDYRINPQVLIVLLQKEQGLITDDYPNSRQYRSATGYGCPDTAPCSSQYYGFKNQVRKAAAMFRTVLDGGWTNFPLGENYIQYNPNAGCGGSVVNIRSLATSALYRYTPYQPNAGALAAGYGTAYCGAYGNRNFYLYFEDWFGGVTSEGGYVSLGMPRYMRLKLDAGRINPYTGEVVDFLEKGMVRWYETKIRLASGEWCLRTEFSTLRNMNACIKISDLEEVGFISFENPRYMKVIDGADRVNPYSGEYFDTLDGGTVLEYTTKTFSNGEWYYRTKFMTTQGLDVAMAARYLEEVRYDAFENPRYMKVARDANVVNPYSGESYSVIKKGEITKYTSKTNVGGRWYYRSQEMTDDAIDAAVLSEDLEEVPYYQNFVNPRLLRTSEAVDRLNPYTGEYYDTLRQGEILMYTTKIFIDGVWYYRTKFMTDECLDVVVPAVFVEEVSA